MKGVLLLALGAVLLFGYRLGNRSLENQDIIRDADIAAEMLRDGDWLIPRSCGKVYVEKPPLFLWAEAACGKLMGGLTPLAARLPSLLSGVALVLCTALLGRFLYSWRAGVLSGIILATTYDVWFYARSARDDMMFAALTLAALCALLYAADKGRRWGWTAAGLLMAGAMLIKGPLGAGLPLLAFLCWRYTMGAGPRPRLWVGMAWAGMLAISLVGLGYYLNVHRHARPGELQEMLSTFFLKENLERVRSGWDHTPKPLWFYLQVLVTNTLPWGALLPLVLFVRWPRSWKGGKSESFLYLWLAVVVAGFSCSAGKSARYLLPVYPAVALLIGRAFVSGFDREPYCNWMPARALWVFPPLFAVGAAWAVFKRPAELHVDPLLPGIVIGAIALYTLWALRRNDLWRSVGGVALAFAVGAGTAARSMETNDAKESTCRAFAEEVRPFMKEGHTLHLFGRDFFRSGLCYYLGRTLPVLSSDYHLFASGMFPWTLGGDRILVNAQNTEELRMALGNWMRFSGKLDPASKGMILERTLKYQGETFLLYRFPTHREYLDRLEEQEQP